MKIGFSLSPGGLLLPYHLGALAALARHGLVTESTPLAGSSAGAIAVASHAAHVDSMHALEATVRVSQRLRNQHQDNDHHRLFRLGKQHPLFSIAQGQLLPALEQELHALLPKDAHLQINERDGLVALAHRQVFPRNTKVLKTQFDTRQDLMEAICDSSMFPYFLTNRPVLVRSSKSRPSHPSATAVSAGRRRRLSMRNPRNKSPHPEEVQPQTIIGTPRQGVALPRMVVDGFFACSAERMGCPDFNDCTPRNSNDKEVRVDRTVLLSVFPKEMLSLTTTPHQDLIGPSLQPYNLVGQATRLVQLATQASDTPRPLYDLYDEGFGDAEQWVRQEQRRQSIQQQYQIKMARRQQP